MPVRDGAAFLAESVTSVREQTLRDLELVVVDDGSTDATAEILAEAAREDDRIVVVRRERQGATAARNHGCAIARGRYLAMLDADDVATADRLRLQVGLLD